MGETCGLKMIYGTIQKPGVCTLCEKIAVKKRKLAKAYDDWTRFAADPRLQATAAVRAQEVQDLRKAIKDMEEDKQARVRNVGNGRRADAQARAGEYRPQHAHYG